MKQTINPKFAIILLFVIGVAIIRIMNAAFPSTFSDISPLGAIALFSGSYISHKTNAYLLPLLILFASDLVINQFVYNGQYGLFYEGWFVVYAVFALLVFIGKKLIQIVNFKNVIIASIAATLGYWAVVDFASFAMGGYDAVTLQKLDHSWANLVKVYIQGMPFIKKFFVGTMLYSFIMFGMFELIMKNNHALALKKA